MESQSVLEKSESAATFLKAKVQYRRYCSCLSSPPLKCLLIFLEITHIAIVTNLGYVSHFKFIKQSKKQKAKSKKQKAKS